MQYEKVMSGIIRDIQDGPGTDKDKLEVAVARLRQLLPEPLGLMSMITDDGSSARQHDGLPESSRISEGSMPSTSAPPMTAVLEVPGWCQQTCHSPWPPVSPSTVPNVGKYQHSTSFVVRDFGWIVQNDAKYVKRILERQADLLTGNLLQLNYYFREHYQRELPIAPTHTMPYIRPERPESVYQVHPGNSHPWTITQFMLDQMKDMVDEWHHAHAARRPPLRGSYSEPEASQENDRQLFLSSVLALGA
jgi:hypothetical protein